NAAIVESPRFEKVIACRNILPHERVRSGFGLPQLGRSVVELDSGNGAVRVARSRRKCDAALRGNFVRADLKTHAWRGVAAAAGGQESWRTVCLSTAIINGTRCEPMITRWNILPQ